MFQKCLQEMEDQEFERHVKALAAKRNELPKKMSEQNGRLWSEILSQQYNFDRGRHALLVFSDDAFERNCMLFVPHISKTAL